MSCIHYPYTIFAPHSYALFYMMYIFTDKWTFDSQAISLQALESILTFSNGVSAPKSHPGARM